MSPAGVSTDAFRQWAASYLALFYWGASEIISAPRRSAKCSDMDPPRGGEGVSLTSDADEATPQVQAADASCASGAEHLRTGGRTYNADVRMRKLRHDDHTQTHPNDTFPANSDVPCRSTSVVLRFIKFRHGQEPLFMVLEITPDHQSGDKCHYQHHPAYRSGDAMYARAEQVAA
jgi:hypothetical protein